MQILVIDDEQRVIDEICEFLKRTGHQAVGILNPTDGLALLKQGSFDILILDVKMPEISGIEFLSQIKPEFPELDVIIISGHGDMETVIDAMRAGAADYLKKPFRHQELRLAMERTQQIHQLKSEINRLTEHNTLISQELFKRIEHQMVGNSPEIKHVIDLAMKASAYSDLPVLITGESGTGKEIIARLIHHASERKAHNFLGINCSAIPENMLESEFFGYKRGAFTGALSDRKGFFEYSDQGTLFLDELADMPMILQSKLLRVLEDKVITKLGLDRPIPVNVRIISATNHDLTKYISEGRFRLDLLHRINTFQIHIPPLRERKSDIPLIAQHYIQKLCIQYGKPLCTLHYEALAKLLEYSFPGNVRELKNLIERAILIANSSVLLPEYFPLDAETLNHTNEVRSTLPVAQTKNYNLDSNETYLVNEAMQATDNNQTKAAELLGISRHALIRKLKHINS